MKRYSSILLLCAVIAMSGCSEPELPKRHYREFVVEASPRMDHGLDDPHAGLSMTDVPMPARTSPSESAAFEWDTPEGWRVEPGFGMRLATLWIDTETEKAECTLIVLGGDAGGLQANIERWMGQVQLTPPTGYAMRSYLDGLEKFETAGGLSGVLIDFDEFVDDPNALSTLAGIMERGTETIFVKLTGTKALLARERDQFIELCKSVR